MHHLPLSCQDWQEALRRAVRDPRVLCQQLELPESLLHTRVEPSSSFPTFVPWEFLRRMRKGDPQDPLLRQVLPLKEESDEAAGFLHDPVGDRQATQASGLLQKYQGRALLVVTGACAVHCRYCFRRHFPYRETPAGWAAWEQPLQHLARDTSLQEVLLSGGDPLTRSDAWLEQLVGRLEAIPHLRRLRVHTRLPILIPQRITDDLLAWLAGSRLTPIVVLHVNHPAELSDGQVQEALLRLVHAGVPLLNQAVLLRGVNDRVDTLVALSQALLDLRVMPYYLHQLDRVAGAAHFEVPVGKGRQLVQALRARLPGYAVPRYVQEVPGAPSKLLLD